MPLAIFREHIILPWNHAFIWTKFYCFNGPILDPTGPYCTISLSSHPHWIWGCYVVEAWLWRERFLLSAWMICTDIVTVLLCQTLIKYFKWLNSLYISSTGGESVSSQSAKWCLLNRVSIGKRSLFHSSLLFTLLSGKKAFTLNLGGSIRGFVIVVKKKKMCKSKAVKNGLMLTWKREARG